MSLVSFGYELLHLSNRVTSFLLKNHVKILSRTQVCAHVNARLAPSFVIATQNKMRKLNWRLLVLTVSSVRSAIRCLCIFCVAFGLPTVVVVYLTAFC